MIGLSRLLIYDKYFNNLFKAPLSFIDNGQLIVYNLTHLYSLTD